MFLLRIEEVSKKDVSDTIGFILELHLSGMVGEVVSAFAVTALGVDEEKEVKLDCSLG
jgi:hypothetical protein